MGQIKLPCTLDINARATLIRDADGYVIADIQSSKIEVEESNAKAILRCINSHDELLAALKAIITFNDASMARKIARKAIKKAES